MVGDWVHSKRQGRRVNESVGVIHYVVCASCIDHASYPHNLCHNRVDLLDLLLLLLVL